MYNLHSIKSLDNHSTVSFHFSVEHDIFRGHHSFGEDEALTEFNLRLSPACEWCLVQANQECENKVETIVVVFTVHLSRKYMLGRGLVEAEVPVLSPIWVLDDVLDLGVRPGQVEHQAVLPVKCPVHPQPRSVELVDLAPAVCDGM